MTDGGAEHGARTRHEDGYPTLQDSWVWPDRVERLFREHAEGRTLHVCCGESDLGDVTVDADSDRDPDVQADMMQLPFRESTFDTVIADPPWKTIHALGDKHKLFFELVLRTKPNGVILWNAYTLPQSDQTKLEDVWVRQDFPEGKASIIAKYRRFPDQQTLSRSVAVADGGGADE